MRVIGVTIATCWALGLAAGDLDWKPLVDTNRAPVSVAQPVASASAVVAVRGDVQDSQGRNVSTFTPGIILNFR